jgi:hypothetical protein
LQQVREECAERRAERIATKIQKEKEHKERVDEARKMVVDAVVDAGESQTFADAVADIMYKEGKLLKTCFGNDVNASDVEQFGLKVKQAWFKDKLMASFPQWRLSSLQKEDVCDWILQRHSSSSLPIGAESFVWREALKALRESPEKSANFSCPVCMEPLTMSSQWFAPLRKNEHWSNQPCGHACCHSCMKMWAETAINDQKTRIKCPAIGCSYSLWDHEVQALVNEELCARFLENKNTDHRKHLKSVLKEDKRLNAWLKGHARPCPECNVIVSRYEGCDHMVCVCGTHFCYRCGCKKCRCGSSRKARHLAPKGEQQT